MKKTVIVILVILGVLLVAIGGYLTFEVISSDSKKKPESNEQIDYDKILGVERNNAKGLKNKACLGDVCFNDLKIFKEDDVYYVTANVSNNGTNTIESEYLNLVFKDKNGVVKKDTHYIIKMEAKEIQPYELHFIDNGEEMLNNVESYSLEKSNEEDIRKYNLTIEDI